MKVNGEVQKVFTKVNEKTKTKFYSICVSMDGKDQWVGCGMTKPNIVEGDTVTFTAVQDGKYWKVNAADIKKVTSAPVETSGGAANWGFNSPERQKSIVAQSAINMSLEFLGLALANGALTLGTGKASAKYELLEEALVKKAQEFYKMAMNPSVFFDDTVDEEDEDAGVDDDDFVPIPE